MISKCTTGRPMRASSRSRWGPTGSGPHRDDAATGRNRHPRHPVCDSSGMDHATVMHWVAGYERAWRDGDLDAVAAMFTEDATYRRSPYHEPDVGHAGIRAIWLVD